jgi:hypothetical protein
MKENAKQTHSSEPLISENTTIPPNPESQDLSSEILSELFEKIKSLLSQDPQLAKEKLENIFQINPQLAKDITTKFRLKFYLESKKSSSKTFPHSNFKKKIQNNLAILENAQIFIEMGDQPTIALTIDIAEATLGYAQKIGDNKTKQKIIKYLEGLKNLKIGSNQKESI